MCEFVLSLKPDILEILRILFSPEEAGLALILPFMPAAPYKDAATGGGEYTEDSYWWRHEAYHLNAMIRYDSIVPLAQQRIIELERQGTGNHDWDKKKFKSDAVIKENPPFMEGKTSG
jgi:dipeptidase